MRAFKTTLVAIMLMVVTLTLTSCGGGTPKGDDKKVKALVKQVYLEKMVFESLVMSELTKKVFNGDKAAIDEFASIAGKIGFFDNYGTPGDSFHDHKGGYTKYINGLKEESIIKERKGTYEKYESYFEKVAKEYDATRNNPDSVKLENIRSVSVDEKAKKSISQATISAFGSIPSEITYSAQRNAEGEIYVEVSAN